MYGSTLSLVSALDRFDTSTYIMYEQLTEKQDANVLGEVSHNLWQV
jgi:hypothetical protein